MEPRDERCDSRPTSALVIKSIDRPEFFCFIYSMSLALKTYVSLTTANLAGPLSPRIPQGKSVYLRLVQHISLESFSIVQIILYMYHYNHILEIQTRTLGCN